MARKLLIALTLTFLAGCQATSMTVRVEYRGIPAELTIRR